MAVHFLDMRVKLQDNLIQTDLYSKPADSHSYTTQLIPKDAKTASPIASS